MLVIRNVFPCWNRAGFQPRVNQFRPLYSRPFGGWWKSKASTLTITYCILITYKYGGGGYSNLRFPIGVHRVTSAELIWGRFFAAKFRKQKRTAIWPPLFQLWPMAGYLVVLLVLSILHEVTGASQFGQPAGASVGQSAGVNQAGSQSGQNSISPWPRKKFTNRVTSLPMTVQLALTSAAI